MALRGGALIAGSRAFALLVSTLLAGCTAFPPAPARYELVGYYAGWNAPKFPPTPANIDSR